MFKKLKTALRKFFHVFGYDIVPLKPPEQQPSSKPAPAKPPRSADLELYDQLYDRESVEQRRFYNLGAGGFSHPAWTNVDKCTDWYSGSQTEGPEIDWDILALKPLPIEAASAEIVYTSYTLEHVTDEGVQHVLNEAYRVLRLGGILRVLVPDIDIYYRALRRGDRVLFAKPRRVSPEAYRPVGFNQNPNEASLQQNFLWQFASSASLLHIDGAPHRISDEEFERVFAEMGYEAALDYCLSKCSLGVQERFPGNHINWFNAGKLLRMFKAAGFENPYRSGYGQSAAPVLRNTDYFDHRSPEIGLYFEARK